MAHITWIFHGPICQPQPWALATLQADFTTKCSLIRERMESRESEKLGKWLTEDAMKKTNKWSANGIRKIISYCKKFPESLIRPGFIHGGIVFIYIYIYIMNYIYMYLYNCITTICHYFCHLYRNMFWSQVILSISWFHQELVLVHDLTCSSCQAMGLRWGCQRVLRCHRWLNAFEESGSNHGKGGNSTPWFLVF